MGRRLEFQQILTTILGDSHVYWQPPANLQMVYPCIVYARASGVNQYSDNIPYRQTKRYQVTVIDADPDSEIPDKIAALPMCSYIQHFVSDKLYHDVYSIFF